MRTKPLLPQELRLPSTWTHIHTIVLQATTGIIILCNGSAIKNVPTIFFRETATTVLKLGVPARVLGVAVFVHKCFKVRFHKLQSMFTRHVLERFRADLMVCRN